jgi:DNA mismatch endonuclease (patch repair protein)
MKRLERRKTRARGVDTFSSVERSRIMRAVRSEGTRPEVHVHELVRILGLRPRLCDKTLPGSPDFVFPRRKKVVFVSGCFWHAHHCGRCRIPKTRRAYWIKKFARNKARDASVTRKLRGLGWSVLTVWECQLADPLRVTRRLASFLIVRAA